MLQILSLFRNSENWQPCWNPAIYFLFSARSELISDGAESLYSSSELIFLLPHVIQPQLLFIHSSGEFGHRACQEVFVELGPGALDKGTEGVDLILIDVGRLLEPLEGQESKVFRVWRIGHEKKQHSFVEYIV